MKSTYLSLTLMLFIATMRAYAQAGGNPPDNSGGKSSTKAKATHVSATERPSPSGRSQSLTVSSSSAGTQNQKQQTGGSSGQGSRKQTGKTVNQDAAGVGRPIGTSTSTGSRKPVKP